MILSYDKFNLLLGLKEKTFFFPQTKKEKEAGGNIYRRVRGDLRNVVFLKKLANLVEAHVEVRAVEFLQEDWVREHEIYYGDRVFKLVRALNHAKFFSLYPGDKEVRSLYLLPLSLFFFFGLMNIDRTIVR